MKKMSNNSKVVLLTTGGTAGHIFPAIEMGNYLESEGCKVVIFGDKRAECFLENTSIEKRIIQSGYSFSIKNVFSLSLGFYQSLYYIMKYKPSVIMGFGSYATFPTLLAGVVMRKKIILHEQNSYVGKVNRFFSRFSHKILTTYHKMFTVRYSDINKVEFTGIPLRKEIEKLNKSKYTLPTAKENFRILILGGSGGASFMSRNLVNVFKSFSNEELSKIEINHQCRENDIEFLESFYKERKVKANIRKFFHNMSEVLSDAHLVISRSGSSIFEFAMAKKPMVLIPSPNVTNNHQELNAEDFESQGAAIIIKENEFDEVKNGLELKELIFNEQKLQTMSHCSNLMAIQNSKEKIKKIIDDIA